MRKEKPCRTEFGAKRDFMCFRKERIGPSFLIVRDKTQIG